MEFKNLKNIQNVDPEQRNDWIKIQSSKVVWLLIAIVFTLFFKTEIGMLTIAFAGASNAKDQYKYSEKYKKLPKNLTMYIVLTIFITAIMFVLFPTTQELLNLLNKSHFLSSTGIYVIITKIIVVPIIYYLYLFLFENLFGSIYGTINLLISKFLQKNKF